jgi:hypothetical protein
MRKREPLTRKEAETIRVLLTLTPVRKEDGELSVLAADLLEKLVDHVVWYHEAKDAERARIVGWLKARAIAPGIDAHDPGDSASSLPSSALLDAAFALERGGGE